MILAVFDCNTIFSALGWGGNPRHCLDLVYAGQVTLCVTQDVWAEYSAKALAVLAALKRPVNVEAELGRLIRVVQFVAPAPLSKRRSRDLKDDRYLCAALGAEAEAIVTSDRDLLVLEKPFGVPVMTPIEFLKFVRSP